MSSYIHDFSNSTTMVRRTTTAGQMRSANGCYQAVPSQRRKKTIDERGLSETLRSSLRALKEHSPKLVFENRSQAVRLLVRARAIGETTAKWEVHDLVARGLIRFEKMKLEEMQPSLLETEPAKPRRVSIG